MAVIKRVRRGGKGKSIRWRVMVRDLNGRLIERVFKTQGEAKDAEGTLRAQRAKGEALPAHSSLTLRQFAEGWLERRGVKASTARSWASILNRRILPALGNTRLQAIAPGAVMGLLEDLRAEGKSRDTARNALTLLRLILKDARKRGLLASDPCADVGVPASPRDHLAPVNGEEELPADLYSPLSEEEAARFAGTALRLSPAPEPWGALFTTALYTGLRRGELLGLRWQDVELEGERPAVRVIWAWDAKAGFITPKSRAARREVPFPPVALQALREWRVASPDKSPDARVFPVHPDGHKKAFKKVLQEAGLPSIRFHDLRGTYASMMAPRVKPKTLQRLMGHSHFAVTMDIYARFSREEEPEVEAAVRDLGAHVGQMLAKKENGAAGIPATP